MRNMSFAMTTQQVRAHSKDVTRRFGWSFLKPGDLVRAVKKGMGLKKGEKIERLATIRIVSTRWEPLNAMTRDDCTREGFPQMGPLDFVRFIQGVYECEPDKLIHRIEFEYVEDEQ